MIEYTKQDVLNAVEDLFDCETNQGPSATAISREIGYSKKNNKIVEILEELEELGAVSSCENDRGYLCYEVADEYALEAAEDAAKEAEKYTVSEFDEETVEIPIETYDYEIEVMSKGFRITFPNGNQHTINKSQRILVINKEKHILVQKPEDILGAIDEYCRITQISNYVIRDMALGRAVDRGEINYNPCLIFLTIERHNKAG